MQRGGFRSAVDHRDRDEDVFRAGLGVLNENVEVPVVVENAGVEQFYSNPFRDALVLLHQIGVRKCRLRILVQVLHVGMRRRAVDVEVVQLLHILAVVTLAVGQAEEPLL